MSKRNWESQTRRCLITWKSSAAKTWPACGGTALFSGTRRMKARCVRRGDCLMRSSAPGNRRSNRRQSSNCVSEENMEIKEIVKERYGQAALRVSTGGSSCCGGAAAVDCCDPITSQLYDANQTAELPPDAVKASLGCGNPTALAELKPGETVLDLGSGGGIDVLLSARRVGPAGKAYGLDMTDEM